MIRSLKIVDPKKTHIKWWDQVEALNKPQTFKFKPGLNVLWGRNGSGKTTLIKALAQLTHCEQSGGPVVTHTSVSELSGFHGSASLDELKANVKLQHDGQGVRHFDPGNAVGLVGGMAGFDYDFMDMGMRNTMFKGSAGQTNMMRFDKLLTDIILGTIPEVEWKSSTNSEASEVVRHFLKGTGNKGQPTILLDEPSRSLDLPAQIQLWMCIRAYSKQIQFIVASHSLYALDIPGANYIELTEGYHKESLHCLLTLMGWSTVEANPVSPEVVAKIKARQS